MPWRTCRDDKKNTPQSMFFTNRIARHGKANGEFQNIKTMETYEISMNFCYPYALTAAGMAILDLF